MLSMAVIKTISCVVILNSVVGDRMELAAVYMPGKILEIDNEHKALRIDFTEELKLWEIDHKYHPNVQWKRWEDCDITLKNGFLFQPKNDRPSE